MMHEKQTQKLKFGLGRLLITPAAQRTLAPEEVMAAIDRHMAGDWGDCGKVDCEENELSLLQGFRLFSVYHNRKNIKFWVITEGDRSATTVMLPEDY